MSSKTHTGRDQQQTGEADVMPKSGTHKQHGEVRLHSSLASRPPISEIMQPALMLATLT